MLVLKGRVTENLKYEVVINDRTCILEVFSSQMHVFELILLEDLKYYIGKEIKLMVTQQTSDALYGACVFSEIPDSPVVLPKNEYRK